MNAKRGALLTCDEEVSRIANATSPRSDKRTRFEISEDGFIELEERYNDATGCSIADQYKTVDRLGDQAAGVFHMAWSLRKLRSIIDADVININDTALMAALAWTNMFRHVVDAWEHHPRFPQIARALGYPGSFLHTASMLMIADYLYSVGQPVGLTVETEQSGPNPDLYIPGVGGTKLFIEVKCPEHLQWPHGEKLTPPEVSAIVRRKLKRSSSQINRKHPGILMIGSTVHRPEITAALANEIPKVLRAKGRDHKGLAAMGYFAFKDFHIYLQGGKLRSDFNFRVEASLNDYFDGPNPVLISSSPRSPR
ncbi:MAG TPA: hypothetical protein VIT45_04350 [Allosphingosinicella sp.]